MRQEEVEMQWKSRIAALLAGMLAIAGFSLAKPAEAAAGFADIGTAPDTYVVEKGYEVDGDYIFTPEVTEQTRMTFHGTWDNTWCSRGQANTGIITTYWPKADTAAWSNTRSAVLTDKKKGNLFVSFENVGEYLGEQINMRLTLKDWSYFDNLPYEDYANVIVTTGYGDGYPVVDTVCLKSITVEFSYYRQNGESFPVRGHYTMNDLDYGQGFQVMENGNTVGLYCTPDAAARMGYDAGSGIIWSENTGTTPENTNGWVTYLFDGDRVTMKWWDGTTNPKTELYQYKAADVSRWPDLPERLKTNMYRYYQGASRTWVSQDVKSAWNSAEFGYFAEAAIKFSPKANVVVTKTDGETGEALAGAAFTCYEWSESGWKDIGSLSWDAEKKYYLKTGLERTSANQGKFKIVETRNPSGYTGTWEKEFTIMEEGTVTLKYEAANSRKTGKITIRKSDAENGAAVTGAVFQIIAGDDIRTVGGTVLAKAGTVVETLTINDGTATSKNLEFGSYTVKETAAAPGYVCTGQSQAVTLSDSQIEVTVEFKNTPNQLVLRKVSKNDGSVLEGVKFKLWLKTDGEEKAAVYRTDQNGEITLRRLAAGTYCYRETRPPEGYLPDDTVREFTVGADGKINGQGAVVLTVENDYIKLELSKVDASTGAYVPGAKMALYQGNTKTASWTSGTSAYRIDKIAPGEYTLVEEAAPDGYQQAEPVAFTVENTSEVQKIIMKDLKYTDLTVVKKIRTDEITWAHGNPTFLFTVEGKDLSGENHRYQKFVTFTEEEVTKNAGEEEYAEASVTFRNIPMGSAYEVSELQTLRYGLTAVTGTDNVTIEKLSEPQYGQAPSESFRVSADLEQRPTGTSVTFENRKYRWDDYSHSSIVENIIPIKK